MPNWFVAFPISLPPRFAIEQIPDGLNRMHPKDVHCTLAFLGHLHEDRVPKVMELLRSIAMPPLTISLFEPLMLPSAKNFSALSLRVDQGHRELSACIAAQRDGFYKAAECDIDRRPVLAHVTIARPHRRISAEQKNAIADWCGSSRMRFEDVRVDTVALYTWATNRSEQKFSIVADHLLKMET